MQITIKKVHGYYKVLVQFREIDYSYTFITDSRKKAWEVVKNRTKEALDVRISKSIPSTEWE